MIEILPLKDNQKFASMTSFLNYIISFEIDYLAQKDNYEKIDQKPEGWLDQLLVGYGENEPIVRMIHTNTLESLGSDETFLWGLEIFVNGLATLSAKSD